MSQPPAASDKQPESPHPRIDQHSSGDYYGGQQAAVGDGNFQYQDNRTTRIYLGLQDEDLEPLSLQGKVLNYLGVFIVLVLTLIFWFFFGLFASFPFPYHQTIELLFSCFRGTLGKDVNRLQKQIQLENFDHQSIEKLNEVDFQTRLYLRILENLGANKSGSHEKLAKTIEALKQKRSRLQDEIKPRQPKKYKTVNKAQDFLESIILSQTEKDLIEIETILNKVSWSIKNNYPSETIVQDTIHNLSKETTRRADKISPSKIGLLYRIEALLYEVSFKELSSLGESELNDLNKKIIGELREQKDTLSRKFDSLLVKQTTTQQALENYSKEIDRLKETINQHKSHLLKLQEKVRHYSELGQSKQAEINALSLKLTQANEWLRNLQTQKNLWVSKINQLNQDARQNQSSIDDLATQLARYSEVRMLEGKYIGNLSDRNSKYHFDNKCNHWKMLVGEYVLRLDTPREIVSKSTSTFFRGKLAECDKCAGRKI